jgi:hypothetical protein
MTFTEYMSTEEGQRGLDPTFVKRLRESGTPVDSLNSLTSFAKARWPTHYSKDWRKSTVGMQHGREAMQALWARYLEAQELAPADSDDER